MAVSVALVVHLIALFSPSFVITLTSDLPVKPWDPTSAALQWVAQPCLLHCLDSSWFHGFCPCAITVSSEKMTRSGRMFRAAFSAEVMGLVTDVSHRGLFVLHHLYRINLQQYTVGQVKIKTKNHVRFASLCLSVSYHHMFIHVSAEAHLEDRFRGYYVQGLHRASDHAVSPQINW